MTWVVTDKGQMMKNDGYDGGGVGGMVEGRKRREKEKKKKFIS